MKCGTRKERFAFFVFSVVKSGKSVTMKSILIYYCKGRYYGKTVNYYPSLRRLCLLRQCFRRAASAQEAMSLKSICENRSSRRRIYVYIRTAEAGFSPDKISDLTALFENTDDINDDSTVQLNYNDIRSRYYDNNRDIFDGIMNLLSDSEKLCSMIIRRRYSIISTKILTESRPRDRKPNRKRTFG